MLERTNQRAAQPAPPRFVERDEQERVRASTRIEPLELRACSFMGPRNGDGGHVVTEPAEVDPVRLARRRPSNCIDHRVLHARSILREVLFDGRKLPFDAEVVGERARIHALGAGRARRARQKTNDDETWTVAPVVDVADTRVDQRVDERHRGARFLRLERHAHAANLSRTGDQRRPARGQFHG